MTANEVKVGVGLGCPIPDTIRTLNFYIQCRVNCCMSAIAVEYYDKKFGEDKSAAFVHLVREIGEIAFAMEKSNVEHAKMEITESAALLYFLATKYSLDLDVNMKAVYTKKMEMLKTKV